MPMIQFELSQWGRAAEHYLEEALEALRGGDDPIPDADAAMACMRIEVNELEPDPDLLDWEHS